MLSSDALALPDGSVVLLGRPLKLARSPLKVVGTFKVSSKAALNYYA